MHDSKSFDKFKLSSLKIDKYYRIKWDGFFLDLAIKNLKEDPPGHLIFILWTKQWQALLPTVRSRAQHFFLETNQFHF